MRLIYLPDAVYLALAGKRGYRPFQGETPKPETRDPKSETLARPPRPGSAGLRRGKRGKLPRAGIPPLCWTEIPISVPLFGLCWTEIPILCWTEIPISVPLFGIPIPCAGPRFLSRSHCSGFLSHPKARERIPTQEKERERILVPADVIRRSSQGETPRPETLDPRCETQEPSLAR